MEKSKKNIIIFDSNTFPINFLKKIKQQFKIFNFIIIRTFDKKKLYKEIKKANALINCPRNLFTENLFSKFYKIDWVHTSAAGVEEYLVPSFVKSKIPFTNGKILQGPEVADHALALLLALSRNIKSHSLNQNTKNLRRPFELYKKKALIVGFGGIGKCILERLDGFGMVVDVISEELPPLLSNLNSYYEADEILKICKNYNVIISSAPLTKKTKKIFNQKFFKMMKKDSIFINVSRGGLVDTKALLTKKINEKFWGIGLDVTDPEPLSSNHPLRKKKNVIITNHTAGLSDYNRSRAHELIIKNLKRYLNNEPLFNQVNKAEGY
tara:strand:- start:1087 stop:2058 length:972 start_codon:yes stop_codon:yes gene_type:complete